MSDLYSLVAQLAICTGQKNLLRVYKVMHDLALEMQYFNALQAPVVEEARKFLYEYLAKSTDINKEQYN